MALGLARSTQHRVSRDVIASYFKDCALAKSHLGLIMIFFLPV